MESRFLEPYRLGRPIVVAGKTITAPELDRIQIYETRFNSDAVNREIRARDKANNTIRPVDSQGRLDPLILSQHGVDVTRRYISGPPGYDAAPQDETSQMIRPAVNSRDVLVVHGRNNAARDALFELLRAFDLHPLEWSEAVSATGKASPYIGEILDAAFSRAHAVIVLFTPDDEARLREPFQASYEPPHETQLTGQARPNVLFEAGMAMARDQDRTVLVELGSLRPFSDVAGRHAIRLDNTSQSRQELAMRLRNAGCPIRLEGTGWHTAGDLRTVADTLARVSSSSTTIPEFSQLSEDAKELLVEATKDPNGMILTTRTMGGVTIQTNRKGFTGKNSARSDARWKQAIDELEQKRLIEDPKGKGEAFEVTHSGFQLADALSNQGPGSM